MVGCAWISSRRRKNPKNSYSMELTEEKYQAYLAEQRKKKYGRIVQKGPFLLSKDGKSLVECQPDVHGKVVIPSSVTNIDVFAFENCKHITELVFPEGMTRLGSLTFANGIELHTLHIPNSMKIIHRHCFRRCRRLYYVTMPSHMIVEDNAFPNRLVVLWNFLWDKEARLWAKLTGKI